MCTLRLLLNGVIVNICLLFSPRKKCSSYIVILSEIQINTPQGTENKQFRKLQSSLGNSQEKSKVLLITK